MKFKVVSQNRLDTELTAQLNSMSVDEARTYSRNKVSKLISNGIVLVNGKIITKRSFLLEAGDYLEVAVDQLENSVKDKSESSAEFNKLLNELEIQVLFENDDFAILDKPSNLVVHPGANTEGIPTLLDWIEYKGFLDNFNYSVNDKLYLDGNATRRGIVHRLDKGTTGVIVVAKNHQTHLHLSDLFKERKVSKHYLGVVCSTPKKLSIFGRQDRGTFTEAIGRDPKSRVKMAVDGIKARDAVTHWEVVERFHYGILVRFKIETGRTHQIRVHCQNVSSPLIGDKTYGNNNWLNSLSSKMAIKVSKLTRPALHAESIEFEFKSQIIKATTPFNYSTLGIDLLQLLKSNSV